MKKTALKTQFRKTLKERESEILGAAALTDKGKEQMDRLAELARALSTGGYRVRMAYDGSEMALHLSYKGNRIAEIPFRLVEVHKEGALLQTDPVASPLKSAADIDFYDLSSEKERDWLGTILADVLVRGAKKAVQSRALFDYTTKNGKV